MCDSQTSQTDSVLIIQTMKDLQALSAAVKARQQALLRNSHHLYFTALEGEELLSHLFELHWEIRTIAQLNNAIRGRTSHDASDVLDMIILAEQLGLKLQMK